MAKAVFFIAVGKGFTLYQVGQGAGSQPPALARTWPVSAQVVTLKTLPYPLTDNTIVS